MILVLVTAAGCVQDAGEDGGVIERDSAGVRIIENRAPLHAGAAAWRVADLPQLVIGGQSDDPTQQLFQVRLAVTMPDGGVVVAQRGEARIYDASGQFVRAVGVLGQGPGEIASFIAGAWPLPADSLVLMDFAPRRFLVFDASGRFARAFSLAFTPPDYPQLVGRLPSGEIVGYFAGVVETSPDRRAIGEVWRSPRRYVHFRADGTLAGEIVTLPGPEYTVSEYDGRRSDGVRTLGRVAVTAAAPGTFYYGDSDTYRILAFDLPGNLQRVISRVEADRAITDARFDAYVEERMTEAEAFDDETRRAWRRFFATVSRPESLPAYRRARADAQANLWVQEYDIPGTDSVTWSVFSPAGRWITDVRLARGLEVLDIGADHLLALRRDELDVEQIVRLRLDKPAS